MLTARGKPQPKQANQNARQRFRRDDESRKRVRQIMNEIRERRLRERIKGVKPGARRSR